MERYGVAVPRHTCDRTKKLLKSWVDGKHEESYARLCLAKAFGDIFPECNRRIHDVHYYRNFSAEFPSLSRLCLLLIYIQACTCLNSAETIVTVAAYAKLHLLFWTACNAYNKHKESIAAYEWLLGERVEHWARYTFCVHLKFPDNTPNFVESFNEKIELFRYKPPGHVVPRVKILITKTELESRGCLVTLAGRGVFEVLDGSTTFIVNPAEECPKLGPPPVQLKKCRLSTSWHNSRSHKEGNVLDIRRGKDKPRNPKVDDKRRVGRPSKVNENTLKKAKTTQGTSSQPTHYYTFLILTKKIKNFFISASKSSTFFKSATFFI
ncbi:hypothetical protein Cgig2_030321 [Carnegiea gigantea]|uniref:Uncharacterized protein n=1 Tax=Carnegiea gigantea TaxID=171969 RepID=A0A9Q1JWT6_9CARY|nr:hypothetical protein Cgig2_030321 [Carnegiea gigantea]